MAEEDISKTTESLKRIQTFDPSTLVQREKLGQYAFDDAVNPAEKLISLFNQMHVDMLNDIPLSVLHTIHQNAEIILIRFQEILDFDQNNTEGVPNADKVRQLIDRLNKEYERVFPILMPLITYAAYQTTSLRSIENEARAMREDVANLADRYKIRAIVWLFAAVGFGILILSYSVLLIWWFNASWLTPADTLQAIQLFAGKLALFATLAFALGISTWSFLANLHNEVANRHRQNALATFQTLADAANTPENRDVVLTHAAASVFTPQDSGFTKSDAPSTPQLTEIVQRVVRSGSTGEFH